MDAVKKKVSKLRDELSEAEGKAKVAEEELENAKQRNEKVTPTGLSLLYSSVRDRGFCRKALLS